MNSVFVLEINSEKTFSFTGNFCLTKENIPLAITYEAITLNDINKAIIETINEKTYCVIYASNKFSILSILQNLHKTKYDNVFVYYNSLESSEKIGLKELKDMGFDGVKIQNLIAEGFYGSVFVEQVQSWGNWLRQRAGLNIKENEDEVYRFLKYKVNDENKSLECQSWFEHFLSKGLECDTKHKRLIQFSGTCYLTSIISGLFMSVGTRLLLKEAFLKFNYINQGELSDVSCPAPREMTKQTYLLKLIYHMLCEDEKHVLKKTENPNLFRLGSGEFFSTNYKKDDALFGEGGLPMPSLIRIFNALSISFLVCNQKKLFSASNFPDDLSVPYEEAFKTLQQVPMTTETDIIIFNNLQNTPGDVVTSFQIHGVTYILQFSSLLYKYASGGSDGHAVLGIFCNHRPVIFDTAKTNFLFTNWLARSHDSLTMNLASRYWSRTVNVFKVNFSVYMREEKYVKLLETQPKCK